jgi:tetratricopeptide (TPR) repeat protein
LDQLGNRPSQEHLFTVKRLLADTDAVVRAAALRFLEHVDIGTRVDLGWPLLEDPVRSVRLEAALLLAPLTQQRLPESYRAQLDKRIAEYRKSQYVNADRPEAHLNLGVLAMAQARPGEAETAYRAALRLDPSFAATYVNLADLYRKQGRDTEGERVLSDGIAAAPEEPTLYYALGLLQVREKRLPDALPNLHRASELAPEHIHYAYVYALALDKAGEKDSAVRTLEDVVERDPDHRDAVIMLVNIHRERADQEAAESVIEAARSQFPEDPQIKALTP